MLMKPASAYVAAPPVEYYLEDKFGDVLQRFDLPTKIACYDKGAEIFWEESATDCVYQVTSGAVRNYKLLSDGRCQITAFYLAGDVFGLDCGAKRQTTADAIGKTTVKAVKRIELEAAASKELCVTSLLRDLAIHDLEHARNQMILLGRKTALERVAAFLLEMDKRLPSTSTLPLPMNRRDIGDYLGLTLETVSRALSQFHEQGIIDFVDARHVALKNRDRLRYMES